MNQIKKIRCIIPFQELIISRKGYCFSCCPEWTKMGYIAKVSDYEDLKKIWNHPRQQYLRQAIYNDDLKNVCKTSDCPYAQMNRYIDLEDYKKQEPELIPLINEIMKGRTKLENLPHTLEISHSGECNLECKMCYSNHHFFKIDRKLDDQIYNWLIPPLLGKIKRLKLSGGEPLLIRHSRKLLENKEMASYPDLKIQLITNALLFTPRLWSKIKHNNFDWIITSIDAATKETYEKIRRNGKWEKLMQNLELISKLRKEKRINYHFMSFVVMKSNYLEIKEFTRMALEEFHCDTVLFQKIFGMIDADENINFSPNRKILIEIKKLLNDPLFKDPRVDTNMIAEYFTIDEKKPGILSSLNTLSKEILLKKPLNHFYKLLKTFPWIYCLHLEINRKRKTILKGDQGDVVEN